MMLKIVIAAAALLSSLLPVAQAADSDGANIPMISIPGRNYEIGKTEVTQGQWKAVMGENPSFFDYCGDECPVDSVSWDDVQQFIQKLNAKTGKQYRLPNEDEWEYACRGGSKDEYCGGGDLNALGWYSDNSREDTTHPVGLKKPNGYGLYDMSGNVWEWSNDKYEAGKRVVRGGSCRANAQSARAAFRFGLDPAEQYDWGGFRLARTLP